MKENYLSHCLLGRSLVWLWNQNVFLLLGIFIATFCHILQHRTLVLLNTFVLKLDDVCVCVCRFFVFSLNAQQLKMDIWWLKRTRTTAAAGPTNAYRSPPSKDSQQLQAKEGKKQLTPTKTLTSELMVHTSIRLYFSKLSGEKCHML